MVGMNKGDDSLRKFLVLLAAGALACIALQTSEAKTLNGYASFYKRINERGPFIRSRVIDLSLGAAKVVGLNRSGVAKVKVVVLE